MIIWANENGLISARLSNAVESIKKRRGGKRDKWTPHICCELDIWFQGILCAHWEACIQNTSIGLLRFHYLQLERNKSKDDFIILITCSSFFIWSTNRIQFETTATIRTFFGRDNCKHCIVSHSHYCLPFY